MIALNKKTKMQAIGFGVDVRGTFKDLNISLVANLLRD
jgi:hypothetical protein